MAIATFVGQESIGNTEMDLSIEVAFMSLERIAMKLDRLIWKLLKMKKSRSEIRGNGIEAHPRRMFGIPVRTERQWKRLAEEVKRKEKERDMKHWK